jgi:hypothetical protein
VRARPADRKAESAEAAAQPAVHVQKTEMQSRRRVDAYMSRHGPSFRSYKTERRFPLYLRPSGVLGE